MQVMKGVYEYTDRQEPEKRPYEHSNHSDETLVDSNHESTKPQEARNVPRVHLRHPANSPHRFMIPRIIPFNAHLQLHPTQSTPSNSNRLRHLPQRLLATVTGQLGDTNHQRVGSSSLRITHNLRRKRLPRSPCCLRMFWVLPSGGSRYRKPSSRFSNAWNLVDRCITYLFL